jgi:hypothetical protein
MRVPGLVWPVSGGVIEGVLIHPFYSSVPFAASQDECLYRVMALLEVIRGEKPEEIAIARTLLTKLMIGNVEGTTP